MRHLLPCLLLLLATPVGALTLDFGDPAAQTTTSSEGGTSIRLPDGAWTAGATPARALDGLVEQTAWRIDTRQTTLQILTHLQAQLEAEGWHPAFACETATCGGFDFRYALPLITEPDMHVDLGDFRYLLLDQQDEALALVVSRARAAAFVQLIRVRPESATPRRDIAAPTPVPAATPTGDFARQIETAGSLVLADLVFASGAGTLAPGDYPTLRALADYMDQRPQARVALVGHTGASGGLAANIALSRARAQSVRKALTALGISGDRIEAEGVGYLAPRSTNLTPEGRTQNRRVEVMLTSTQLVAAP